MKKLKVKLAEGAIMPTRATKQSAGLDLYAMEDFMVPPTHAIGQINARVGRYRTDTGVSIALDPGYVAYIKGRSGLAWNVELDAFNGTIDSDYRGTLKVILYNFSSSYYKVKKGDRIAQLVIQKVELPEPTEVPYLDDTERGEGGLGHTGK
jgi:dUTP pyrophosphatase